MFVLQTDQDRFFVHAVEDAFAPPSLITDALSPGVLIPAVESFDFVAQVAPPSGGGVEFIDQTPQEVTITVEFPTPTNVGLSFGLPFGFFGAPLATFDGFLLF